MYGLKLSEDSWENRDSIGWFSALFDAMAVAHGAIEDGEDAAGIEIMSFDVDGNCCWDFPITFAVDGSAWSGDETAREEMGFVQGQF